MGERDVRHIRSSPVLFRPLSTLLSNLLRDRIVTSLSFGRPDEIRHRVVDIAVVDLDRYVATCGDCQPCILRRRRDD